MKTIMTSLFITLLSYSSFSQSFTPLCSDAQGDVTQPSIADIKSISFDMNVVQDSIWFKVETYNGMPVNGDVGLMFGFDTNLVTTDGLAWMGSNSSMNYDQSLLIFQNSISPNYYGYTYNAGGSAMINIIVDRPDTVTFIIHASLSTFDGNGTFNLICGAGSFDILSTRTIFDDAPNSGFISIPIASGTREIEQNTAFNLFPNPAAATLRITSPDLRTGGLDFVIHSATGSEVKHGKLSDSGNIDIRELEKGVYFVTLLRIENHSPQKIMFVKE